MSIVEGRNARQMIDFHVHCDYSIDAKGSIEDYALSALKRGIDCICFTTHCDLDPTRRHHDGKIRLKGEIVDVTSDWLPRYAEDVRSAKEKFSDTGLEILCGLEIGYVPGIEDLIEDTISRCDFDYILAGVHTMDGIDISSPREAGLCFGKISCGDFLKKYYSYIEEAIETQLFDCIAHLDAYKMFALEYYGDRLLDLQLDFCKEVLTKMAESDVALEVNSKALRKGFGEICPNPRILVLAKETGVKMVTIGSDSHDPDDLGKDLNACVASALNAGFNEISIWRNRKPHGLAIEEICEWGG